MFIPWIKRKALKKNLKSKRLVVEGEPPSVIMLLSLSALLVMVGVVAVQKGWASVQQDYENVPSVTPMSPSPTPSASGSPPMQAPAGTEN